VNALTAVDDVVISMRAEPWSLDGIENLLETIEIVREDLNPEIKLRGVIVTMLEPRTALAKDIISRLESDDRLRDHIFATKIRRNVRMAQSADAGMPVIHLDSHCHGAWAYRRLARELLVRLGDTRGEDFPELREPTDDDTKAEAPVTAAAGVAAVAVATTPAVTGAAWVPGETGGLPVDAPDAVPTGLNLPVAPGTMTGASSAGSTGADEDRAPAGDWTRGEETVETAAGVEGAGGQTGPGAGPDPERGSWGKW